MKPYHACRKKISAPPRIFIEYLTHACQSSSLLKLCRQKEKKGFFLMTTGISMSLNFTLKVTEHCVCSFVVFPHISLHWSIERRKLISCYICFSLCTKVLHLLWNVLLWQFSVSALIVRSSFPNFTLQLIDTFLIQCTWVSSCYIY